MLLCVAGTALAQNAAPIISEVTNRSITVNSSTGPISFTVEDAETPAASLTLGKASSNTGLVPLANITFGGSGTNRSVTVTPAANESGSTTITITVDDGTNFVDETFVLTVIPGVTFDPPPPAGITDKEDSQPFERIQLAASDPVIVSVTFPDAHGSLETQPPQFTKSISGTNAVYTLTSRSPANAEQYLEDLVFTPAENRIPITQTETTFFVVRATNGSLFGEGTVALLVTPSNDPPSVSFSDAVLPQITDKQTTRPLRDLGLVDVDAGDAVTVTIEFPDVRGAFPTSADLVKTLAGTNAIYTLGSRSAADARAFLTNLVYTPVENRIPVLETEATTFTVTATDLGGESDLNEVDVPVFSVNDAPRFSGSIVSPINDNQTSAIFANLTVTEVDVARIGGVVTNQRVILTVTNALPGGGFAFSVGTYQGPGVAGSAPTPDSFRLTNNATLLTASLDNILFAPLPNLQPVGESNRVIVRIEATDSIANSPDNGSRDLYIVSINDPPALTSTLSPGSVADNQSAFPFQITVNDPDINDSSFSVNIALIDGPQFGTIDPEGPIVGNKFAVETGVRTLRFTPAINVVTNSQPIRFRFSVTNFGDFSMVTNQILVQEVNDLPNISGVASSPIRINDDQVVNPFSTVQITDVDRAGSQPVSVVISLDDAAKGTLNPPGPFGPTTNLTPAAASAMVQSVQFSPVANRIPVNQTETVTLSIRAYDALGGLRQNNQTAIIVTSVNGAPQILGIPTTQPLLVPPDVLVKPFAERLPFTPGISIEDDDTNVVVTVSLDNAAKGVLTTLGGFVATGPGVYKMTNTPAAITMALTNLDFQVSETFAFPPGAPGGTTFTIQAVDTLLNTVTRTLAIILSSQPRNHLVTRTQDDLAAGSLRYALSNAAPNDVITFALPEYPALIRLQSNLGPIALSRHVAFEGPGADLLTISGDSNGDGQGDMQLFRVNATVKLRGISFTKGVGGTAETGGLTGGAIYVGPNGRLTMHACAITDSHATQWGGGLDVDGGSLSMSHCLVRGNSTDNTLGLGGGGVSIYTDLPCEFINTTFATNRQESATAFGGGALYIENLTASTELPIRVSHCTFAGNQDASGGGSSVSANVFGTLVRLRNSIFADGQSLNLDVAGSALIQSQGGNISDDSTRTILTQGGQPQAIVILDQGNDRTNTIAGLEPLDLNLRPTPAFRLQANSPAIGRAVEPSAGTDQRGVIRDADPDSGATEFSAQQRLVINEIHFDPQTNESDFVELYVLRDSAPVDLSGFQLRVDGTNRFVFGNSTVIQPGRGIILADRIIPAGGTNVPTPVETNLLNGPMGLEQRSRVELLRADGKPVLDVSYVGQFVDPFQPSSTNKFANQSITLAPQFRGFAYLPHGIVSLPPLGGGSLTNAGTAHSAGRDTGNTPFGATNAFPAAIADGFLVSEDELSPLLVVANDLDADGLDQLVVVNVSTGMNSAGNDANALSTAGAQVTVRPPELPLRGRHVDYDPRAATILQELAVGARRTDTFHYTIVDIGTGPITAYQGSIGVSPTIVTSPAHRLNTGETILISGSDEPGYNTSHIVTRIDDDRFEIPVGFSGQPVHPGSWKTTNPRLDTERSEAAVTVTVLGANDPPAPVPDTVATDEETILRIMGDAILAGTTNTVFDTDGLYPLPRRVSEVSLLANDDDVDTDDANTTLHVVGVVGGVKEISAFAGTPGVVPVMVTSTNHGLADGTMILISGYVGHPSYNGYHAVTLVDANTFAIATHFVDHNPTHSAIWTVLNDANRLTASSERGAAVKLEIRADRTKTSVVYNPRTSAFLNATAVGETNSDSFYYAVEDRHAAISLAKVTVQVAGVNDAPIPTHDPDSLSSLDSLVNASNTLAQVLTGLRVLYYLPPQSGLADRTDAQVRFSNAVVVANFRLPDVWTTDEDTPLAIDSTLLTANDSDVDTSDLLAISAVSALSREGAAVSLVSAGGLNFVVYNPAASSNLNRLAREELRMDSFEITVSDGNGGDVVTDVAVLVVGANDTPVAMDDQVSTFEDVVLTFDPVVHPTNNPALQDTDADINGQLPDNQLTLVPVTNAPTGVGALVTIVGNSLTYDPRVSSFLNGLAHTQSYVDTFEYTVIDGSFIFANDDLFKVAGDGAAYSLSVLANDRNFTGQGGALRIVSVGTPDHLGTVAIVGGTNLTYTPEVNFVGDEIFPYTISDQSGNLDSGLVTVRVTVNQLNGNLQANADHFSAAKGESPLLDVLLNDNILPAPGANLTITRIVSLPNAGGQAVLEDNRIRFTPAPTAPSTYPYSESFSYEVTGGGTARAIANVQVLVINRENTLHIRDDAFSVLAGGGNNVLDVLFNDNLLPGSLAGLTIRELFTNSPFHGQINVNAQKTALVYTPNAGFVGEDTLTYVVTDGVGGTGLGNVRITVGHLAASSDFFAVPYDTNGPLVELDVLANDLILQGTAGTNITITGVAALTLSAPAGMIALNAAGTRLVYNPTNALEAEFEYAYVITDGFGRTATGHVTLVVASEGVKANADFFTVGTGSSANILDVLGNDVAIPDQGYPLSIVSVGTGINGPNRGGTVTLNDAGDRLVYTPATGFSGEESFTYTMTDSIHTDVARVAVRVTSGELTANPDVFTVFLEMPAGDGMLRAFTLAVLANDRVLPDAGQLLTITSVGLAAVQPTNAPAQSGEAIINSDGTSLRYTPRDTNGPFPYLERFAYEITDGTARRAAAVVEVEVQQRMDVHQLETNDDAFTVARDSLNNVLRVLANDAVKPAHPAGWTITGSSTPLYQGVVSVSGGTNLLYSPQPGFIGTDRFTYSVSDGLGGTGSAEVRVKVGDLPLCNDVFTAVSGSSNNVLDVLANDAIRHETAGGFNLLDAGGTSHDGAVTVIGGLVVYTPDPNSTNSHPYTETFFYRVQDDSLLTVTGQVAVTVYEVGSDRDAAEVAFTVNGVNDPPTIAGTGPAGTITDKQTVQLFPTVTIGEVDAQGLQPLLVTVSLNQARGVITNLGSFTQTGPGTYQFSGIAAAATTALRALVYDPIENRITVPTSEITTFTISVTDGIVSQPVQDSQTVLTVIAVNDPPIISGTVSNQTVYHRLSLKPFAGVTITEVDDLTLQPLVITVSLDNPANGFLTQLGSFVNLGGGVYRLGVATAGVTAADASSALRALVFVPTTGTRVMPGLPETTRFTITVEDGFAAPVVDNHTTVIAIHEFLTKLGANDGNTGDHLGAAVAASHSAVVAGAPQDDDRGNNSGAAYIYVWPSVQSTQWMQFQKLVPADGAAGDNFGAAVAISGNTVVVGAPFNRPGSVSAGSAYVYERSTTGAQLWVEVRKLAAPDGLAGDEFAGALAIDQDTIVVGARTDDDSGTSSGTAYVFSRHQGGSNNWGFVKKLAAADAAAGDEFGKAVGVQGNTVVVGAHLDVHNGVSTGSAYLFQRNQGGTNNWGQVKKLVPSDGLGTDGFGFAVGVYTDTVAVGSPKHDHLGNDRGAVYLFARDQGGTNNWGQVKEVFSPSALNNDQFGYSVSTHRDKLAVGAPFEGLDNQSRFGGAYAFARHQEGADNWGLVVKLDRSDTANNDEFGIANSIGQDTVAVGMSADDDRGNDSGSVYIYRLKYNNPPQLIAPIPDQIAITNELFELTLSAATFGDPDVGDTLTLTATLSDGSPLPAWLSFSSSTLTFSGTPDMSQTFNIRVTAADEDGATAADFFDIVVGGNTSHLVSGNTNRPVPEPPLHLALQGDPQSGFLTLVYLRPLNASSANYTLQYSDDFAGWNSAAALIQSETVTPFSAATEQVALEIEINLAHTGRCFRLQRNAN